MTDDERQPPLTLSHQTFTRGELEGNPCVVIYDTVADKTTVVGFKSKHYSEAMIALSTLELAAQPLPKSARHQNTVIHMPKTPKLILPGSNASN